MVTKKKPLSEKQVIVLDLLAEAPRRWKDLKATTKMNPKTLKQDVLDVLMGHHYARSLGKRAGYAITKKGLEALQTAKAVAYFREDTVKFLFQPPSRYDSLILVRVPLTGKIFLVYSPDKEQEKRIADLLGLYIGHGISPSPKEKNRAEVFKESCHLFMRSFINSKGSQEYLDAMREAFGRWFP
jgi:DNA-binding HxlR family transcriptional regulator